MFDVFLLVESWHSSTEDVSLNCCVPPGYSCMSSDSDKSSSRTNHEGVAAIITDEVAHKVKTFESLCFRISSCSSTVGVLLLYRPGSQPITDIFFDELRRYLESIALLKCQKLITGDFDVPQGSVLGPVLFLLYTADVLQITQRHGLNSHSYADDIQL